MITKFYVHNFRCLMNFELALDEDTILLGANGTGKTSVLQALKSIQDMIVHGQRIDEVFSAQDLTMRLVSKEQRFEIEVSIDDHTYRYTLELDYDLIGNKKRIKNETLEHDGHLLFKFELGKAQLYHDDYTEGPEYHFDWTLSGVGVLRDRPDNRKLARFRQEIANCIIVKPCPPLFAPETRTEDEFLDATMQNFVGWYRHVAQQHMGSVIDLFTELRKVLPGFDSLNLVESGESSRSLKAAFRGSARYSRPVRYGLNQLSDGQRALIALYALIIMLPEDRRPALFIDEPDNYLSLREIQPWLVQAVERCGESLEQLVVISHHPVIIDYMVGPSVRRFSRHEDGPVRISAPKQVDGLSLSETIARGWDE